MKCWIWPLKVYFAHCSCIQPISPSRQSCLLSRYLNQCTAPENSKRSRYLFSRKRCLGSVSVSGLYYDDILTKLVLRVISYVQHPRDWKNHVSFFISDEIFPTYIAPSLQALSPWCVALPKVQSISNLFGGSQVGEGLGFLSFSLDWSVVGAGGPLYTPLDAQVSAYATRFAFQLFFLVISFDAGWCSSDQSGGCLYICNLAVLCCIQARLARWVDKRWDTDQESLSLGKRDWYDIEQNRWRKPTVHLLFTSWPTRTILQYLSSREFWWNWKFRSHCSTRDAFLFDCLYNREGIRLHGRCCSFYKCHIDQLVNNCIFNQKGREACWSW